MLWQEKDLYKAVEGPTTRPILLQKTFVESISGMRKWRHLNLKGSFLAAFRNIMSSYRWRIDDWPLHKLCYIKKLLWHPLTFLPWGKRVLVIFLFFDWICVKIDSRVCVYNLSINVYIQFGLNDSARAIRGKFTFAGGWESFQGIRTYRINKSDM